jgi:hypothetical protein
MCRPGYPKPTQPSNKIDGGSTTSTLWKDRVMDSRQVKSLEMSIHPSNMLVKKGNQRLSIFVKAALHTIGEDGIRQFDHRAATHNHHRFVPKAKS